MKKSRAWLTASAVLLLAPTPLIAGGYGSTAVADSNVSNQQAAQGMVWCERLDASVTESLFRQMDCGSEAAGIARPAVAGERITNRRPSLFERFPHNRKAPAASTDSDSDTVTSVSTTPTAGDPNTDGPTTGGPDKDGPTTPTTGDPTKDEPKDEKPKDEKPEDKKPEDKKPEDKGDKKTF